MGDPITGVLLSKLLKAVDALKGALLGQDDKKKLVKFKNREFNKQVGDFIINGDVNAPITVIQQDGEYSFARPDNPIIKEKLAKGSKNSELVANDFDQEYRDVFERELRTDYPHPFVRALDTKYRALIKASQYVQELYDSGDRDLADSRKEELSIDYERYGRKFCNLYTEKYIPEVLQYINEVGLVDKLAIQFLLDQVVNYGGVMFVHQWTTEQKVQNRVEKFVAANLNYIAIHGCGSNSRKVKDMKKMLDSKVAKAGEGKYEIKEKHTAKDSGNKTNRHSIFIFNDKGKSTYEDFQNKIFKGFI